MSNIYYFFGLFFLIYELRCTLMPTTVAAGVYKTEAFVKEIKNIDYDDLTPDQKKKVKGKVVKVLFIFTWLSLGIFTFQWPLFVAFIAFHLTVTKFLYKVTDHTIFYPVVIFFSGIVGVVFSLFVIINAYHLHIDIWKWITTSLFTM